jgi:hypothetical protein
MQPEELERAIESARDYIAKRLTAADLVAIASVSSALQIVQDFTADREVLATAMDRFSGSTRPASRKATLTGRRRGGRSWRRFRVQRLQHRSTAGGHRAALRCPGANPAEEIDCTSAAE